MTESLADEVLCAKGITLLEDQLGPLQTLRFLSLVSHQLFDYQRWRQQHFADMSLTEVLNQAQEMSTTPQQKKI